MTEKIQKSIEKWYNEARTCIDNQLKGGYDGFEFLEASSRRQGVYLCVQLFKIKCKKEAKLSEYVPKLEDYAKEIIAKIKKRK